MSKSTSAPRPRFIPLLIAYSLAITGALSLTLPAQADLPAKAVVARAQTTAKKPGLILVLVIDQFRADYLTRFESRFLPPSGANGDVGGFRFLMSRGAYYPFGQYDILQSMTGPGHATVLSGAYPYQMGIPLNEWYDVSKKDSVYCVEDPAHAELGDKPKPHAGTSPKNFNGTTFGDELKNAGYPSKVVSIAYKDRAAILMGGHRADAVFWFDRGAGQWTSSKYYFPDGKLPAYAEKINAELKKRIATPVHLEMKGEGTGFSNGSILGLAQASKTGHGAPKLESLDQAATAIDGTGFSAQRLIQELQLGKGKTPDLLAVSFSNHDYLGHEVGPNDRAMEELTVYEDKVLSNLFNFVRKQVPGGLANTLIVLTADHGIPPHPEWLAKNRIEATRVNDKDLAKALAARLEEKFGKTSAAGGWVPGYSDFNFYLNREALADKKITLAQATAEMKEELKKTPQFAQVFTSQEYIDHKLPPLMFERQILKTYYPGRSGDVIALMKPFHQPPGDGVTHLTGYAYDRTVPIVLAGPGIRAGRYSSRAEVVDIAPTLSFLSGVLPPALSDGRVLTEALGQ